MFLTMILAICHLNIGDALIPTSILMKACTSGPIVGILTPYTILTIEANWVLPRLVSNGKSHKLTFQVSKLELRYKSSRSQCRSQHE